MVSLKKVLLVLSAVVMAFAVAGTFEDPTEDGMSAVAAQSSPDVQVEARRLARESEQLARAERDRRIEVAVAALQSEGVSRKEILRHFTDEVLDTVDLDDLCHERLVEPQ
ncbi:hypothetical protein [Enterovirga sp. CN4-39]|uniref:hypothetical protein n=1 Tax=Enterovirga sp. CN4-39 TaxID=3400910 RepID=UPI003C078CA2